LDEKEKSQNEEKRKKRTIGKKRGCYTQRHTIHNHRHANTTQTPRTYTTHTQRGPHLAKTQTITGVNKTHFVHGIAGRVLPPQTVADPLLTVHCVCEVWE
jgi:hypothetical protein